MMLLNIETETAPFPLDKTAMMPSKHYTNAAMTPKSVQNNTA
jgi:hypothetical protein